MRQEVSMFLFALAAFAIIIPILAIAAYIRVGRIEARLRKSQATDPETEKRFANLTARLYALETLVNHMAGRQTEGFPRVTAAPVSQPETPTVPPAAPAPPAPAATAPAPPAQPHRAVAGVSAPPFPAASPPRSELDYESLVAGRWLNYAGILAVLFAVAFFLKYAFDNDWVGPRGRVGIGLLFGAALLGGSDALLRRGYRYFSEGIAGLGAAVLYLALWGGWHYYRLFEQSTAFSAMIVVTAAMAVVAIGRNSQRIAVMALAGGFLTPALLSTGHDAEVALFTYCLVLVVGFLTLERLRDWSWLPPLAYICTQIYYWGWFSQFYREDKLAITAFFATIFFVAFTALPIIRSRVEEAPSGMELIIIPTNALLYLVALYELLWPAHRWTITFSVLGLAAAHLAIVQTLPPPRKNEPSTLRLLFSGIALTYATVAIPLRLDHGWLTTALAIEGALLMWSGFRARISYLRAAGFVLFIVCAARLFLLDSPAAPLIFNARFGTYAAVVACYVAACFFAADAGDEVGDAEKVCFGVLGVAANIFALVALSLEVWDYFGHAHGYNLEHVLAQSLGLSVLWTIYAAILIAVGFARKSSPLRWQALALFGIVVAKVFLFDLSFLERFYRIVSFLVLGLLLLLVSFYYQRKLGARTQERRP